MPERPINEQVLPDLAAWGLLALISAVIGGGLWLWLRPGHRRLFPPQRLRAVPWTGQDVAILLFLSVVFWPASVKWVLDQLGFFGWMYAGAAPHDDQKSIWIGLFAVPTNIAAVLLWMRMASGVRFYQLGLTYRHGLRSALLAILAWLVTTPFVYLLGVFVDFVSKQLLHQSPDEHPLFKLAKNRPTPAELVAIILAAVVAAPVWEELLFRGILQRWFRVTPWGSDVAVAGAVAVAFLLQGSKGPWPVLFVLAMIPAYVVVSRVRSRALPCGDAARAIFASALLFAVFHSPVWPTPVPLFALGLILGFLAYRTQSLVAPILLHALFNAVPTIQILLGVFRGV
jgi:membrane protease YdiL (CAAX protease family)